MTFNMVTVHRGILEGPSASLASGILLLRIATGNGRREPPRASELERAFVRAVQSRLDRRVGGVAVVVQVIVEGLLGEPNVDRGVGRSGRDLEQAARVTCGRLQREFRLNGAMAKRSDWSSEPR